MPACMLAYIISCCSDLIDLSMTPTCEQRVQFIDVVQQQLSCNEERVCCDKLEESEAKADGVLASYCASMGAPGVDAEQLAVQMLFITGCRAHFSFKGAHLARRGIDGQI